MAMHLLENKPVIMIEKFDSKSVSDIMGQIDNIEQTYNSDQPIILHINSYGGSVHGMAVIYNRVKTLKNPIVTYTSSKAMSAGAILLSTLGGKNMRFAAPGSTIMVHEISAGSVGDIKDIEDTTRYLRQINQTWMTRLAKSMGLKNDREVRKLIDEHAIGHDIYLTANKAKKLGLVDEVCNITLQPYHGWLVTKV